jgi:hypothetical protein
VAERKKRREMRRYFAMNENEETRYQTEGI